MTKEELKQYRWIIRRIAQLREQIDRLQASLESAKGTNYSTDPRIPGGFDMFGDRVAKLVDMKAELEALLDEMVERSQEIISAIRSLEDMQEQFLMWSRYIEGKRWEQIAVDMGYSIQHVWRLHGSILEKMRDYESLKCEIL